MGVDEAKKIVDDTLNRELSSKGFLVASYDKILTWQDMILIVTE